MPLASEIQRADITKVWRDPTTFASCMLALLIDEYGTDALAWEPETIRLQVATTYKVQIPQVNMDKLLGLITAMTTELFYKSTDSFNHIANALNDAEAQFETWDPVDPEEAAWAITEVGLHDPPRPRSPLESRFSEEIKRYIGVILADEGILTPPDVLSMAVMSPAPTEVPDDDPAMMQGYMRLSAAKGAAVTRYLQTRMQDLLTQMNQLPLQNRNSKSWERYFQAVHPRLSRRTASR